MRNLTTGAVILAAWLYRHVHNHVLCALDNHQWRKP